MEQLVRLRLLLGDQLNTKHSWFARIDPQTVYLMAEMHQETTQVTHHLQKIVAFFQSMRNFADSLESQGHKVVYHYICDNPQRSLSERIIELIAQHPIECFEYQLPDNFRLDQQLQEIAGVLREKCIKVTTHDTEHFLTTRDTLTLHFKGKKQLLMESFYRMMRKKHNILLTPQGDPEGGKWNYDHENRKSIDSKLQLPNGIHLQNDIEKVVEDIRLSGIPTLGSITTHAFFWPTSRDQAITLLDYFCEYLLPYFGTYQDAMLQDEPFLFHSKLSFALNAKLIDPKEVIDSVLETYRKNDRISLAQVEGFIRQILGWREYMRGIYWKEMPEYSSKNYFGHHRPLPTFYWTGKTKMNCLSQAIGQTLEHSYAHHIQRLMITGNFALLAEIDPDQVDQWYLGVYIDAIQWVEITNTRGMSQFADGGIIATKPYISSGAYIDKMSNYCKNCQYSVKEKTGPNSCPFNSLYWNFLEKKKDQLSTNPRMAMMYRLLEKKDKDELSAQIERAELIIEQPDRF